MTASTARTSDGFDPVPEQFRPSWRVRVAATGAVAATYVYFLIFAQFGLLKMLQASPDAALLLKPIMGAMAAGGVAGSVATAWWYTDARARAILSGALVLAGAGAGLALGTSSPAGFFAVAALTGLGAGGATVTLGATLRRAVGSERLGRCVGVGTGIAYGFCNLPFAWTADWRAQTVMGGGAALLGLAAAQSMSLHGPPDKELTRDYEPRGIALWVAIFLALVWFDSAAFYVMQHTPAVVDATWNGSAQLYANAAVHFAAAVLAGYLMDRDWLGRTVLVATAMLLLAGWLILRNGHPMATGALIYVGAVSFYSTALVFYPARSARAEVAAMVYAMAGWGGSALGISLVDGMPTVPGFFWIVAGGVVTAALLARARVGREDGAAAAGKSN